MRMMMMMIALLFGLDGTPLLLPHKQFVSPLPLFGHVLKSKAWGNKRGAAGFALGGQMTLFF